MAKPYHKNPRQITAKQYEALAIDLAELGDLGGIVHDLNSDEIIGGNQRGRVFDLNACDVVLTEVLPEPDTQGTVAHGYVIWKGAKYAYRQVRWTPRQCERANIVANKRGGTERHCRQPGYGERLTVTRARTTYTDQTRAQVMAALLAGQSVSAVASEYKVPRGTIARWRAAAADIIETERAQKSTSIKIRAYLAQT